uniref:WD_REPEATS_REGION domain-containing protein n=1 Tax=Syphacia muris TaxID=451379 RepID=A0A0N5AK11_9BILA
MMNTVNHSGSGNSAHGSPIANPRDELKTQFITREGVYRQMTLSEYSRPNRISYSQGGAGVGSMPVRVSFLTLPSNACAHDVNDALLVNSDLVQSQNTMNLPCSKSITSFGSVARSESDSVTVKDIICFNIGRELYVYFYRGVNTVVDLNKPIDKRVYKGTFPTCHDFNKETATASSCSLIIGFSAGQIQLIDPFQKEFHVSHLFNEDRFIDKTAVTCLRWVPGQSHNFLASHTSGNLYLYSDDLPCMPSTPLYQVNKEGDGYTVYTCKAKVSRNPIYRYSIGNGPISQFAFSFLNGVKHLATVGHDGYLRVFNFETMKMTGFMKSYFGGLSCLAWSPDSKYIVTGGEDDLVTVYSVLEKRIVCRGLGHKSWVSQVAFDPFTSHVDSHQEHHPSLELGSDDELHPLNFESCNLPQKGAFLRNKKDSISSASIGGGMATLRPSYRKNNSSIIGYYRFGSVGQDTQLCLWDLTDDILRLPSGNSRQRNSTLNSVGIDQFLSFRPCPADVSKVSVNDTKSTVKEKKSHKRGFSLGIKLGGNSRDRWNKSHVTTVSEKEKRECAAAKLLGTAVCPYLDDVTIIEPLVRKKIAHERLTGLAFREDSIVTVCQEGFVVTWARPGKVSSSRCNGNSPVSLSSQKMPGATVV